MSNGAAVVPVAGLLVVAVPVAALATAGAVVVLAVRGCMALVEVAGAALGGAAARLGAELEASAARQEEDEVRDRLWSLAATEVLCVNRRIELLRAQAKAAKIDVKEVPEPLRMEEQSVLTMHQWLVRTEPLVDKSQTWVQAQLVEGERRALLRDLPKPRGNKRSAAELLALLHMSVSTEPPPRLAEPVDWAEKAAAVLLRLDKDALPIERERAMRLAAQVAAEPSDPQADAALTNLSREVTGIGKAATARRKALIYLAVLETKLANAAANDVHPQRPHLDTNRRLRLIAEGRAVPDDDVWAAADAAVEFAREVALAERKLEAVAACLKELKYDVQTTSTGLRVVRSDWKHKDDGKIRYSADFSVSAEDGRVTHRLYRHVLGATDYAGPCHQLNADVMTAWNRVSGSLGGPEPELHDDYVPDYREEARPAPSIRSSNVDRKAFDLETGRTVTTDGN